METLLVVVIIIMALAGLARYGFKATRPDSSCGTCPKGCKSHCRH